jgi:hypothetical protein
MTCGCDASDSMEKRPCMQPCSRSNVPHYRVSCPCRAGLHREEAILPARSSNCTQARKVWLTVPVRYCLAHGPRPGHDVRQAGRRP